MSAVGDKIMYFLIGFGFGALFEVLWVMRKVKKLMKERGYGV